MVIPNAYKANASDGIIHIGDTGTARYTDFVTFEMGNVIETNSKYYLSFMACGSGTLNTNVFPGAMITETGSGGDGKYTWHLTDEWRKYEVTMTSVATLYSDSNKKLLFRLLDHSSIDLALNSVVLRKVGGR